MQDNKLCSILQAEHIKRSKNNDADTHSCQSYRRLWTLEENLTIVARLVVYSVMVMETQSCHWGTPVLLIVSLIHIYMQETLHLPHRSLGILINVGHPTCPSRLNMSYTRGFCCRPCLSLINDSIVCWGPILCLSVILHLNYHPSGCSLVSLDTSFVNKTWT